MRDIFITTNQLTANSILESWFVQNIVLQEISFGLEWEIAGLRDSVVIYLELAEINCEVIKDLKSRNNKVVLCQMGDEFLKKYNQDAYLSCDLVLRNYFFPEILAHPEIKAKTHWIPNGYKSGIGPRQPAMLRQSSQRRFMACFLGWLDNGASFGNERALFREAATKCPQDLLMQPTVYFGQGFGVGMYSAIMETSVFCPCPAGNSPETIRLYDALELGCIPISLRHDFLNSSDAIADPPFPLLDNWEQMPELLARYRATMARDPQSIVREQQECLSWWTNYKKSVTSRVATLLLDLRRS